MEARTALWVALGAAGLAIALVAVDLQFETEVRIESMKDGEWVAATGDGPRALKVGHSGCASQELRIVIDHDGPFAKTFDVEAFYWSSSTGQQVVVLDESVRVDAGGQEFLAFDIPRNEFIPEEGSSVEPTLHLEVQVDGRYYGACVQEVGGE